MLLDEPLANLDYKLREELRAEMPRIFAATGAIFVYATTEPAEALLLGGNTATLWEGRVTQFGPTPRSIASPADADDRADVLRPADELHRLRQDRQPRDLRRPCRCARRGAVRRPAGRRAIMAGSGRNHL